MASKRKRKQPASSDPPPSDVQVVVFEDPLKKRSKKKETDERIEAPGSSFDWHKARQDVFRFGITGFEHKEQTDAKVSLAVKLGARPTPNKCINYKKLMEQRKQQKEEQRVQQLESGNDHYKLKPLIGRKKRSGKKDQKVQPA